MGKKILTYFIVLVSWLTMWPMAVLYYFSNEKANINADIEADMAHRRAQVHGLNAVLYVLLLDRYYRTLFYHRVGLSACIVSWLWHGASSFYPLCRKIGGGIYLAHPFSTILNAKAIGENFTCRQNTTIGNKTDDKPHERPTIGNNVNLGANVVIIGNVKVGNNVIIGAGSVVVKDIPDNAVVAGNPARIIRIQDI